MRAKSHICRRLKRLIERERLKGVKGHWSYDLNRHIGLKQALDTLKSSMREDRSQSMIVTGDAYPQTRNGASQAPLHHYFIDLLSDLFRLHQDAEASETRKTGASDVHQG